MMRGIVFGAGAQSLLVGLVGATALAGCNLLFGVDESDLPPQSRGGTGGTSGVAGGEPKGGSAGDAMMGSAGVSGVGGIGGAGDAGGQPCDVDATCTTDVGTGSLCVGERCTKAADGCLPDTVVAVLPDFAGAADPALAGACYHRDFGAALSAVVDKTTTRLVVYAPQTLTVAAPLAVPAGLTLEGRTAEPSQAVALAVTAPVADAPLVTLGPGAGLKGFALDGAGMAAGIKAETGAVRLEGPLTVVNTKLALELGGAVDATVFGRQGSAVRLSGNARGIVVGSTAKLVLSGDGEKGGVIVEGTTEGAGVLVLAGGSSAVVRLEGLLARNNTAESVDGGAGAVEARQGRGVSIRNGVFEANGRALTLNGEGTSNPTSFINVRIEDNRFVLQDPPQGNVVCGSRLGSQTQFIVDAGNVFPGVKPCPAPQVDSCGTGADVGYDTAGKSFAVTCGGT